MFWTYDYKCGPNKARQDTTYSFARNILKNYRENKTKPWVEYLVRDAQPTHKEPVLRQATVVKPYFDRDEYTDINRPDLDAFVIDAQNTFTQAVREFMIKHSPPSSTFSIFVATRHGPVCNNAKVGLTYKLSFRAFVNGVRTDIWSLRNGIDMMPRPSYFDSKVYDKTRRMCSFLCPKSKDDTRILTPARPNDLLESEADVLPFIIQHVEPTWPIMTISKTALGQEEAEVYPRKSRRTERGWEHALEDEDVTEEGPRLSKRDKQRAEKRKDCVYTLRTILHDHGFLNPRAVAASTLDDDGVTHVDFDCDAREDCPICHQAHENNMWVLKVSDSDGVMVSNHSDRCRCVSLLSTEFMHPFVALATLGKRGTHAHYADAFKKHMEGTVLWDMDGQRWLLFKGQKWEETPQDYLCFLADEFFRTQLFDPAVDMSEKWVEVSDRMGLKDNAREKVKNMHTMITNQMQSVSSTPFLKSVLEKMRSLVIARQDQFDMHDNLLHFEDGVLNLDDFSFRETLITDMNTRTTGTCYQDTEDEIDDAALFQRVMDQIYPPDIMRVAQKCIGSSIVGDCPAKKIFVHTDGEGDKTGSNGKTLIFDLVRKALGGYYLRLHPDMLYNAKFSQQESASPNLCALKGVRCSMTEELNPKRQLDVARIKDWTSGVKCITQARQLYKSSTNITIQAKFHVACNHLQFPSFPPDEAMRNRLVVIPYISQFVESSDPRLRSRTADALFQRLYPKDEDLGKKLEKRCMRSMMQWMLEGYKAYKEEGIEHNTLPEICNRYKEELMCKQSVESDIVKELLIPTGNTTSDQVHVQDLMSCIREDKRHNKRMKADELMLIIKTNANSMVPNSAQDASIVGCSRAGMVLRGFKMAKDNTLNAERVFM